MNKQFSVKHGHKLILAIVAFASLGFVTTPARADNALIQESVQESVATGKGNVSIQNSNQTNRQYTEYRELRDYGRYGYRKDNSESLNDGGSTGIVQLSNQYCDQVGEYNTCVQDAQQANRSGNRRIRRSRF